MPYFPTSQEWLDQSALLLKARPSTTRISTKYSIKPPRKRRSLKQEGEAASEAANTADNAAATQPPYRATLVLKTYDPVSGVCLKYATDKAAEVGRLINSLGRLGRTMAGLPDLEEATGTLGDVDMADAPQDTPGGATIATDAQQKPSGTAVPAGTGQSSGGGKKKKKGKK